MGFKKPISTRHNYKKSKKKKPMNEINKDNENKELQELETKVREIMALVCGANDLKNTAKIEILGDEQKKPLINQAWQLIDKIHEISKKKS